MKRTVAIVALAILTPVAVLLAGPEAPWIPGPKELTPYSALKHTAECQPGGQTAAIARGSNGFSIGLYLYGPDGQCIGKDDGFDDLHDERIVVFTPVESGPYEMVVRSYSTRTNTVLASFRASGRGE